MANRYKGKIRYKRGIVFDEKTGTSHDYQTDAWKKEADCGCGIDCCEKELVLTDQVTGVSNSLFFNNGGLFVRNNSTGIVSEVTLVPVEGDDE